jgi:hypothetical protein
MVEKQEFTKELPSLCYGHKAVVPGSSQKALSQNRHSPLEVNTFTTFLSIRKELYTACRAY